MPTENQRSYLSGKVRKVTLPVFNAPPGDGAPALKRLLLPQGELAQFHDGASPVYYLAFVELRDGTLRGNHWHNRKQESIYVLDGEFDLTVEDTQSKVRDNLLVQTGDLVAISPGVAHVLRITKPGHAVEFSTEQFDPADIHRYPL
jgi:mannose-6-phosphate isomerase-like protein (cupin superfamily)